MRRTAWLAPLLLSLFGAGPWRQGSEAPLVPELEGVRELSGKPALLADAGDDAVLLFFHAGSSRYSLEGLDALVERLVARADTRARARLFVLSASVEEARAASAHLASLGEDARSLVDPERRTFALHEVIAAPTVLCLTPERRAVARVQGYGALFAFRAELGARLAAGLLDAKAYAQALAGVEPARAEDPLEARQRLLVGRLVAGGQLQEAEALLTPARERFPAAAWPLALAGRCALARSQTESARAFAALLAQSHPDTPERHYLDALLLEAAGQGEQACAAYRATLERCLFE